MTLKRPLTLSVLCATTLLAVAPVNHAASAPRSGLIVDASDDLRACEVLVIDAERDIAAVASDGGADVVWKRRGARIAIALAATEDVALGPNDVYAVAADGAPTPLRTTVDRATCFDRAGRPVAHAVVHFE